MKEEERFADGRWARERTADRLRLLTDASAALAATLDPDEALRRLAQLVVGSVADACVVDVIDGGWVRRLATVGATASSVPSLPGGLLPGPENSTAALARVLLGAGPSIVTDFGPPGDPDSLQAGQAELYRALEAASVLIVPLQARQDVLGALTLVRTASAAPFNDEDVVVAADLARRGGMTLENARLYAFQHRTAEQLQLSLLPDLSRVEHLQLAARYVPAARGAEVGGDWYDAFRLPDGSTVLAVGDVVGHDLSAAVRMGQMRNMLRALAYDSGDSPAGLMCRLDGVMQGLSTIELVTAVTARLYTPASSPWLVQWTNAGHPPPLLTGPADGSRLLEAGLAPVLGVDPAPARDDAVLVLPPDSTLLFYTDGLIERPGEDIGRGLDRLCRHAADLARHPVQEFCDRLLDRLADAHHDDIALLALRVPG